MDHQEFVRLWEGALAGSDLLARPGPTERLDLRSLDRSYECFVEPPGRERGEPFYVCAKLAFSWDALNTARSSSREEDVLVELFGEERAAKPRTKRRLIRVDAKLSATLTYGVTLPLPPSVVWSQWVADLDRRLEPIFPREAARTARNGDLEIDGWRTAPELAIECTGSGELGLKGLSVSIGRLLEIPRHWDDPERKPDPSPERALKALFSGVRRAFEVWIPSLSALRRGNTNGVRPRPDTQYH